VTDDVLITVALKPDGTAEVRGIWDQAVAEWIDRHNKTVRVTVGTNSPGLDEALIAVGWDWDWWGVQATTADPPLIVGGGSLPG
jgi:hypothetical protein